MTQTGTAGSEYAAGVFVIEGSFGTAGCFIAIRKQKLKKIRRANIYIL